MATVLLIKPSDVTKNTSLSGNVDPDTINPHILTVQDLELAYVIGFKLMEKIMTLVEDQKINDPGNEVYKTLLEGYIQPYLWHRVGQRTLSYIRYRIGSSGVNQRTSEQGVPAQNTDFSTLYNVLRSDANGYQRLLIDYLCANSSKYPEYQDYQNGKQSREIDDRPFSGWETY